MAKQERSRSAEQAQPRHEIAGTEVQPRRDGIAGNGPEKRKAGAQELKRGQTPSWSKTPPFDHIIVCKRKRSESPSTSPPRKRAYPLPLTQDAVSEAIEDLHYTRRYYENHPKATFPKTYRAVAQVFLDPLRKRADLNETPYIYRSPSPEPPDEYESDSGTVSIPSQPDTCDLFGLTVRTPSSSPSPSPNSYHREASVEL